MMIVISSTYEYCCLEQFLFLIGFNLSIKSQKLKVKILSRNYVMYIDSTFRLDPAIHITVMKQFWFWLLATLKLEIQMIY